MIKNVEVDTALDIWSQLFRLPSTPPISRRANSKKPHLFKIENIRFNSIFMYDATAYMVYRAS